MKTDSGFFHLPVSRPGKWSISLSGVFVGMLLINSIFFMNLPEETAWRNTLLPIYGVSMVLTGLSAGMTAALAVFRNRERSWLIWLPLLAGLMMVFLLIGEFLFPH